MALADIPTIAHAIGTALGSASPSIRYEEYLADTFTPPVCLVGIDTVDFHASSANDAWHHFKIFIIMARGSDRAAWAATETIMSNTGPNSIRKVLEGDGTNMTLGGVVDAIVVEKAGPPVSINIDGVAYLSCVVECRVKG